MVNHFLRLCFFLILILHSIAQPEKDYSEFLRNAQLDTELVETEYEKLISITRKVAVKFQEIPAPDKQFDILNALPIHRFFNALKTNFDDLLGEAINKTCNGNIKCHGSEIVKRNIAKMCLHTDKDVSREVEIYDKYTMYYNNHVSKYIKHVNLVEENFAIIQDSKKIITNEYKDKENRYEIGMLVEYYSAIINKAKNVLFDSVEQLKYLFKSLSTFCSDCVKDDYPEMSREFYEKSHVKKCLKYLLREKPSTTSFKTDSPFLRSGIVQSLMFNTNEVLDNLRQQIINFTMQTGIRQRSLHYTRLYVLTNKCENAKKYGYECKHYDVPYEKDNCSLDHLCKNAVIDYRKCQILNKTCDSLSKYMDNVCSKNDVKYKNCENANEAIFFDMAMACLCTDEKSCEYSTTFKTGIKNITDNIINLIKLFSDELDNLNTAYHRRGRTIFNFNININADIYRENIIENLNKTFNMIDHNDASYIENWYREDPVMRCMNSLIRKDKQN